MRCGYHVRWRLGRVVLRQPLLGKGRNIPHGLHRRHLRRRRRLRRDCFLHAAGTLFRDVMRFHDDCKCFEFRIRSGEKRNFLSTNMPAIVKTIVSRNKHSDYQALPEAEVGQGEGRDRIEGFPRKQGEPEGGGRGGGGCLGQPVPLGCRGGSGVTRGDSCDERGLDTHDRDFICDLDGSVITGRSQTCELIPAALSYLIEMLRKAWDRQRIFTSLLQQNAHIMCSNAQVLY